MRTPTEPKRTVISSSYTMLVKTAIELYTRMEARRTLPTSSKSMHYPTLRWTCDNGDHNKKVETLERISAYITSTKSGLKTVAQAAVAGATHAIAAASSLLSSAPPTPSTDDTSSAEEQATTSSEVQRQESITKFGAIINLLITYLRAEEHVALCPDAPESWAIWQADCNVQINTLKMQVAENHSSDSEFVTSYKALCDSAIAFIQAYVDSAMLESQKAEIDSINAQCAKMMAPYIEKTTAQRRSLIANQFTAETTQTTLVLARAELATLENLISEQDTIVDMHEGACHSAEKVHQLKHTEVIARLQKPQQDPTYATQAELKSSIQSRARLELENTELKMKLAKSELESANRRLQHLRLQSIEKQRLVASIELTLRQEERHTQTHEAHEAETSAYQASLKAQISAYKALRQSHTLLPPPNQFFTISAWNMPAVVKLLEDHRQLITAIKSRALERKKVKHDSASPSFIEGIKASTGDTQILIERLLKSIKRKTNPGIISDYTECLYLESFLDYLYRTHCGIINDWKTEKVAARGLQRDERAEIGMASDMEQIFAAVGGLISGTVAQGSELNLAVLCASSPAASDTASFLSGSQKKNFSESLDDSDKNTLNTDILEALMRNMEAHGQQRPGIEAKNNTVIASYECGLLDTQGMTPESARAFYVTTILDHNAITIAARFFETAIKLITQYNRLIETILAPTARQILQNNHDICSELAAAKLVRETRGAYSSLKAPQSEEQIQENIVDMRQGTSAQGCSSNAASLHAGLISLPGVGTPPPATPASSDDVDAAANPASSSTL